MKLILFVGHHKIGSTALQNYLSGHSMAMLENGVLYPAVERQGLKVMTGSFGNRANADRNLPINYREAHNALAFRMMSDHNPAHRVPDLHQNLPPSSEMLATIHRQIEAYEPHTVILAAEVFANFGVIAPGLIETLAQAFPGAELHLTATLRRVDDYMVSWHAQRLRFGQKPVSLPDGGVTQYLKGIHFDYRLMLKPWIDHLPGAKLRLRSYDQVRASGGAVRDFLTGYGIPPAPGHTEEPRLNTGLHRALIEIARQGNHQLEDEDARGLLHMLLEVGGRLDLPSASQIEMYGAPTRALIADRFAPVESWLAGIVGGPFFGDPQQLMTLQPMHEYDANLLALHELRRADLSGLTEPARAFLQRFEPAPNFPLTQ